MKDKCFICEEKRRLVPDKTGNNCGMVCRDCRKVLKIVSKKRHKVDFQRYEQLLIEKLALAEQLRWHEVNRKRGV